MYQEKLKNFKQWSGAPITPREYGDLEEWVKSYETICEIMGIKDTDDVFNLSANLPFVLDNAAMTILGPGIRKKPWNDAKEDLKNQWGIKGGDSEVTRRMVVCRQQPEESVSAFAGRFKRLCALFSVDDEQDPDRWRHVFEIGLRPELQERMIMLDDGKTFDKIYKFAVKMESAIPKTATSVAMMAEAAEDEAEVNFAGRGPFRNRGKGRGKPTGRGWTEDQPICFGCQQPGHFRRNCPKYTKNDSRSSFLQYPQPKEMANEPARNENEATKSSKKGRKKLKQKRKERGKCKPEEAREAEKEAEKTLTGNKNGGEIAAVLTQALDRDIKIQLTMEGKVAITAMADTGADVSLISEEMAAHIEEQTTNQSRITTNIKLQGANGKELQVRGEKQVEVSIGPNRMKARLIVVRNLPRSCIIGKDLLEATSAVIFTAEKQVAFPDAETLVQWAQQAGICKKRCSTRADPTMKPGQCLLVEKRLTVAELKAMRSNRPRNPAIVDRIKFGTAMPQLVKPTKELLREFSDCFAEDADDFGHANVEPLKLKLKDKLRPVHQQPRRLNLVHQEFAAEELERWKKANRVSPSSSPVAVCAHVVPKPSDGKELKWRYVINFPAINDQIETDVHPCGNAELIFDSIHGAACFNKFDFSNAFLQIPMHEESRWLTSFVTEEEQLEFNYVPFGIKPAPAKLQRELNNTFRGLPRYRGYADDWLGAPRDAKEHLATLRDFLSRVRESGFLLKPEKCHLLFDELKFLGRRLTLKEIGPDEDSLAVVRGWPRPTCKEELDRFLGLARWYAPFVKGYAELARPLYNIIKQHSARIKQGEAEPWSWSKTDDSNFAAVKAGILTCIKLTHIDLKKPFVVETDASRKALGAVLLQDGKIVKLLHRVLKPVEVDMHITLLELAAVMFALEKWEHYLLGRTFTIKTDHKALTWLGKQTKSAGKLSEWALQLGKFDYKIEYVPGTEHQLADAISRRPEQEMVATVMRGEEMVLSTDKFLEEQAKDAECKQILKRLQSNDDRTVRDFVVNMNGVLCQLGSRYSYPVLKPVVPKTLTTQVIAACHQEVGHRSEATTKTATAEFFWSGMQGQILEWLKSCKECQARKGPNPNRKLPKGHITSHAPNELVMLDILGGLMPSSEGWKYILLMMDAFTRFAVAAPLKTKTAEEVADVFERIYIQRYGTPKIVHSDQGGEFEREFLVMLRQYRIKKSWTTAYHPQGDGIVERTNRTILNMLSTTLQGNRQAWPDALEQVMRAFNASQHRQTGLTPEFLMLGDAPIRLASKVVQQPKPTKTDERQRKSEWKRAKETVAKKNRDLEEAAKRSSAKSIKFKKGQLVSVYKQSLKEGAYGKLELPWVGPCRILKVEDNGINYVVKQLRGPVAGTFNVKNIKDFFTYYTPKPKAQHGTEKKPMGVLEQPKDLRWLMDWGPATQEQARLVGGNQKQQAAKEKEAQQVEEAEQSSQNQEEQLQGAQHGEQDNAEQAQQGEPQIQAGEAETTSVPSVQGPVQAESEVASAKMGVNENPKFGGGGDGCGEEELAPRTRRRPAHLNDYVTSIPERSAATKNAKRAT